MANESKKDFNAMLADSKDMPKIQVIADEKSITKYGGNRITIPRSFPLGVSNEITEDEAVLTVHTGKVLCVISKK